MQQHQPASLAHKLDEAPHGQDGANHRKKIEEQTNYRRSHAQRNQRNIRKTLGRMHSRENGKKVSIQRRRRKARENILASRKKLNRTRATRMRAVPNAAQFNPNVLSTNRLTRNGEFCASCHGITLRMLVCMAKYKIAIPMIEMKIARGMFFSGSSFRRPDCRRCSSPGSSKQIARWRRPGPGRKRVTCSRCRPDR